MAPSLVVMPQLGADEPTALVAEWLVGPGTEVKRGMEIAVVETAKATTQLEAEQDGFLYPLVQAGTEVSVRAPIAFLLDTPDDREAARVAEELAGAASAGGPGEPTVSEPHAWKPALAVVPRATGSPEHRFAVYGASQGGASLVETIRAMGGRDVVAFLDDTDGRAGTEYLGLPVWAGADLERLAERGVGAVATQIAIRRFRLEVRDRALRAGLAMPNAIDPAAHVSPSCRMGRGNVVKAGAVIETEARLGDCCIVDNGAVVPHHNVIGDAVHLAPGVALGGDCRVGAETLIGVGAVVSARVTIGRNVIVAPGSVVVRDVPDEAVVEGSPARVVGTRRPG